MDNENWPEQLPAVQLRVARPTNQLDEIIKFYCDGLGLKKIGGFHDHIGYTGVMLGLPGHSYHLEFTQHSTPTPNVAPPTGDNLLVFYIPDKNALDAMVAKLTGMGYKQVPPENDYWANGGVTIEDPDGWRVVLMNTDGI